MTIQDMLNLFQNGQIGAPQGGVNLNNALLPTQTSASQTPYIPGANTNQVQGGAQAGQFGSTGVTDQETSTGAQQQGATSQQGTTNGGSVTGVNDTLGMGALLQGQQGAATATDATRGSTLNSLMQQGDPALQQQVSQAVSRSLSGPGMQGVGQGAQARAAGDAAAQIGMNSAGTQLAASQQAAGPTATTTLAAAGNPYLGQTQQNVQNQSTTGQSAQNTTGQSSAVGGQSTQGTANSQNQQQAFGLTPQQSTSSGGGSVICTALGERGWLPRWMLEDELFFVSQNWKSFKHAARCYFLWGTPVAKLVRRNWFVAILCYPFANACAYEAARRSGITKLPCRWWASFAYYTFLIPNTAIGFCLPGKPRVTDPSIVKMLRDAGLNMENL
jgi:hypothetical protein